MVMHYTYDFLQNIGVYLGCFHHTFIKTLEIPLITISYRSGMSGRVNVRGVYVWSGKCPSGICPRVIVGRVYVLSGKCPVTD